MSIYCMCRDWYYLRLTDVTVRWSSIGWGLILHEADRWSSAAGIDTPQRLTVGHKQRGDWYTPPRLAAGVAWPLWWWGGAAAAPPAPSGSSQERNSANLTHMCSTIHCLITKITKLKMRLPVHFLTIFLPVPKQSNLKKNRYECKNHFVRI